MRPIKNLSAKPIDFLFTDLDDTLTTQGKVLPEVYDVLWKLKEANVRIVLITGRPAGWCDLLARWWPVDGVVGENGAFYFRMSKNKMIREFWDDPKKRQSNHLKLQNLRKKLFNRFPHLQTAADQPFRMTDLAIDLSEDVPPIGSSTIEQILKICKIEKSQAKVSSIHINAWYGQYDKFSMCERYLKKEHGIILAKKQKNLVFSGDSPNDEPMFKQFKNSVGVANIKRFAKSLKHPPKFVTKSNDGHGFLELANHVLKSKK